MAKIQNIYAIASDGTKITVTASAVGAVPTDQVATSSVLGLIKTGDNTIQGQENGVDVNYLEVNAAGKGFMPAFDITKYFEKYAVKGEYKVYTVEVYITDSSAGTNTLVTTIYSDSEVFQNTTNSKGVEWHNAAHIWYGRKLQSTDSVISDIVACQLDKTDTNGNYVLPIDNVYMMDTLSIDLSNPADNISIHIIEPIKYDHFFEVETVLDQFSLGLYFNIEKVSGVVDVGGYTVTGTNLGSEWYLWNNATGGDKLIWCPWFGADCYKTVSVFGNATGVDYPSAESGAYITWKQTAQSGKKTSNRVVLDATDPNIGIVDIDTFQHATTSQYGIVQFPADYYEDDGTPKIATDDKQGTLKVYKEYDAYTTEGSYTAAPLLLNSSNVGYVEVLPATTTAIGSIMISDSSTYDASTISNKTIAWVNLNGNRAFVYVNLASQQYRGSVRVQSKYTAYSTLDSQTAAYLRITDAGYGYVTVLPATTSAIGSIKVSSVKTYETNSTIGNTVAWVNIHTNNMAYVAIQPATASMLGSVIVSAKYTAYSTEDSQTAAYLRINSAGKAYTPMLTETWTFTVLDDSDNESTVDKNVVLG